MGSASAYHIVILLCAVAGVFRGWRKGMLGQVGGLLGLAFGIVFCRLFHTEAANAVRSILPFIEGFFAADFIYASLGTLGLYTAVYLGFRLLTSVFGRLLRTVNLGAIDSVAGSALCLFKYMVAVSIAYNVWIALFPTSALMAECRAGDGNMVECVTDLAPALFGTLSPHDMALRMQLREADKISYNIPVPNSVITSDATAAVSCNIIYRLC